MTATAPHLGPSPVRPVSGHPVLRGPLLRRLLAITVLIGTVLGTLLAGAGPAAAHAALTGSNPKDGAVVATAPTEVTLTFSEQIALGKDSIRVLDPSGERADESTVRDLSSGGTVAYAVDLLPGLPDGTYTVAWQAVSADSHPISGAFTFSIGAPSETEVALPREKAGEGAVAVLYDISRYTAYAGFLLMAGAAAFILLCWPRGASVRPLQRLVVRGWVTLTAATLATLLLRSPYTGSGELADAFDLGGLQTVLETKTGAALVSRLLLLGAAALFIAVLFGAYTKRDGDDQRSEKKDLTFGLSIGGSVVAAGIAATWALSEHASTGIQVGLAMPVDVLHLLAAATWLGGLVALLTALHRVPSLEPAVVRRFSGVAFASVVTLAVTGIYQSWRQVGSWSALTGTSYGQLLLAKVALVALMVGVAWFSRRWTARLTEPAAEPAPDAGPVTDPAATPDPADTPDHVDTADPTVAAVSADSADPAAVAVDGTGADDPARAAQLARQQAAVATAQRKKERDADPGRTRLRRSVLAEAGIAVVVLAVTTVLTTTEPGRTEEEAARTTNGAAQNGAGAPQGPAERTLPFDTGGANGKGTLRLSLGPAAPGANEMHLWVDGPGGKPMDVPELKISLTLQDKQIGPLPVTPTRLAAGHWSAGSVQIPMPGDWQLQVTVRTSDIDQTTIDETVRIG